MAMKDATVIGLPVINAATGDGIITVLELEELVFLGMTYGAWFKIGMGVALLLLIVERILKVRNIWMKGNVNESIVS